MWEYYIISEKCNDSITCLYWKVDKTKGICDSMMQSNTIALQYITALRNIQYIAQCLLRQYFVVLLCCITLYCQVLLLFCPPAACVF